MSAAENHVHVSCVTSQSYKSFHSSFLKHVLDIVLKVENDVDVLFPLVKHFNLHLT